MKAQYAILRFAKYKGPEIGHIESHNERTKEKYASNPDVDTSRSHLNFHLVTPRRKYRTEAEKQIAEAGCRTRSDSVRVVEALVTASPEFFKGKKKSEIKAYFQEALAFIEKYQAKDTIISAVVHMDEKTPHTENQLVAARAKKMAIEAEKLTGDNIYKVLIFFDKLYSVMDDQEKRQLMESLLSEVQIYEERQPNGQWLKSIKFKLPIIAEDMSLSLDNDTHIETVVLLSHKKSRQLYPH